MAHLSSTQLGGLKRPRLAFRPVRLEPREDAVIAPHGERGAFVQAIEEPPVSSRQLCDGRGLAASESTELEGTRFEVLAQLQFHDDADGSRRFPIPSIGYFRVAQAIDASDISDMGQFSLKDRIRARLDATGKAPIPLARELGRGRDFISDILNGRKDTLPSDALTALAIALDCDERYFTDPSFTHPGKPRRQVSGDQLARYDSAARDGTFTWAWRDYRRLSIDDVAQESGLTPGTVSDIEQGLLMPTAAQLASLAAAFGTSPGMLQSNPFRTEERVARLVSITEDLDPADQATLVDMAEALQRRRAG